MKNETIGRTRESEPFIVRFARERHEGEPLPGYYDESLSLMVVDRGGETVPLITAGRCTRS